MFPLSPQLWIAAGAALLMAVLSGGLYVQSSRLETCHAKAESDKLLIDSLGQKISDQNAAVEALDAAGKAAKVKGAAAVSKARKQALSLQGEVSRLTGLLKQPPGAVRTCSDGVRAAREGLAP